MGESLTKPGPKGPERQGPARQAGEAVPPESASQLAEALHAPIGESKRSPQESGDCFRLLVECLEDYAISLLDPDGRVLTWNQGAERIKGYRADEIIGRHISCFYCPEDVQQGKPEQLLQTAATQGRVEEEGWRIRKDGSQFWADIVVTALRDGASRLIGFSKVIRDLTERRRVEEALRQSETRKGAILESALECIITMDQDGKIAEFNATAERTFGYRREEVIGRRMAEVIIPPSLRQAHERGLKHYLATGEGPVLGKRIEMPALRADGSEFPVELAITASHAGGRVLFTGCLRDITERKRAEEEIKKLNADLERRLAEVTAAYAENAELQAFCYAVSHDLRAPLRSIDGFSQALQEDYAGKLDSQGVSFLERIRAAARRMGQLIDDLLKLSRLTRQPLHRESINLSSMARAVAAELQQRDPERKVTAVIADSVVADGDSRLLRVVLENLLNNAWKFTGKHAEARIEFGSTQRESETVYFVRDDGAGFDMAHADKLFAPFQRLHTVTEFAGSGIGLATVQRIIHRHGGEVWGEGAVEQGATFYFTLGS